MRIRLDDPARLGAVVRATRKAYKLRQDDTAANLGLSENFLGKVERGGDTVQWGKLFQVLAGLGIWVDVDVPESVVPYLPADLAERVRRS